MNESTAQANGYRPVDHFAEAIAETIPPRRRRWTPAEWRTFTVLLSAIVPFFLMGFIVGHLS